MPQRSQRGIQIQLSQAQFVARHVNPASALSAQLDQLRHGGLEARFGARVCGNEIRVWPLSGDQDCGLSHGSPPAHRRDLKIVMLCQIVNLFKSKSIERWCWCGGLSASGRGDAQGQREGEQQSGHSLRSQEN